jgi:hypothetical protein
MILVRIYLLDRIAGHGVIPVWKEEETLIWERLTPHFNPTSRS